MLLIRPKLSTAKLSLQFTLLVASVCLPYVVGIGVFEVKLGEMHNPGGRDDSNRCCTGTKSNGQCTTPCDTRIITCFRQYSPAHPADCTYGYNVSGLLGRNSFTIGKLVQFPFTSTWPGSFNLKVRAEVPGTRQVIIEVLVKSQHFLASPQWNNFTTIPSTSGPQLRLSFSYRFICAKDNYGSDCSKSCTPRDDHFGHYSCDSNGNRVCLQGWGSGPSDTFCENPICNPPCKNGKCKRPNTCSCSEGWKGPTCDQCEVYPGCAHGTCQDKWECNCNQGWGGPYCDLELDYCGRNKPCKHGGCRNTRPGRYRCLCDRGYGGLNCDTEINECASNPCQNGGNCTDKFADYSCLCPTGFSGNECEINIDDCEMNACANGGTCIDGVNRFSCRCPVGFTGSLCEGKIPTETPTKLSTKPYNNTQFTTTKDPHGNNSFVGGERKDAASSLRNAVTIIIPVVVCVVILVCFVVGCVVWKVYRKSCCCCGSSTSRRDQEEPNTRTEVKRVDPDAKDICDTRERCRASTSKNSTPDIIINFVPSRPSNKNINSEQASRATKGKELDLSPLENTRFEKPLNRSQETVT